MKITLRIIISLLVTTGLVVFLFSSIQTRVEEAKLKEDLSLRSRLLAKSFKEAIEPFLEQTEQPDRIKQFIEKFKGHIRLIGILVYLQESGSLITSPEVLSESGLFKEELIQIGEDQESLEKNAEWGKKQVYFYGLPLKKEGEVVGALGIVHDRAYIVRRVHDSWRRLAITFSILALILSVTTLIVIRWSITGPIAKIAEWAKRARMGEMPPPPHGSTQEKGEMDRLIFEIAHMASSLKAARLDLYEQAQVKQFQDSVWNKEKLKEYLRGKLGNAPFFVISNREPYIHRKKDGEIKCIVPASGVVTALDPVLQATGGMWLGHGSGDADRETVNRDGKLLVPPQNPSYSLKRIWLDETEEKGYYYGFSNEGLWPLCHITYNRPFFRIEDWVQYQKVNRKFADALLEELSDSPPVILIQDYHFALLPKMIKEQRPDAKVALFWHIPWPNPEAFGICPWQEEILEGILGSDLIGFHTQFHCNNFLDTVDRVLESRIDWTVFGVTRSSKTSYVRPFPISIAFPQNEPAVLWDEKLRALRQLYGLEGKQIGVGVDRIDYTKGLMERFRAIERTLEKYPQYQGKLVFIELGAPSRTLIQSYKNHLLEVEDLVQKINDRFRSNGYQPILFLKEHHTQDKIQSFYRLADFCMVSSLHDGMNLVAKEFIAAREDENGVLILSRFTGASQELQSALQINPYDTEASAEAVHQALTMLPQEKLERMKRMRTIVQERNVYRWAAELVTELVKSF